MAGFCAEGIRSVRFGLSRARSSGTSGLLLLELDLCPKPFSIKILCEGRILCGEEFCVTSFGGGFGAALFAAPTELPMLPAPMIA
jgi:hypothetical protein